MSQQSNDSKTPVAISVGAGVAIGAGSSIVLTPLIGIPLGIAVGIALYMGLSRRQG